jgi:hypothetical protein
VFDVLLSVPDGVFSSVPVEAQAARKKKTIGARRNLLNFTLVNIIPLLMEGSGYSMLVGGYKQSGGGKEPRLHNSHKYRPHRFLASLTLLIPTN